MAQIGVQAPSNLMEMFSSPSMLLGDIAMQQVNDQRMGNEINRNQALQDMLYEQQMQPHKLEQAGLLNTTTRDNLLTSALNREHTSSLIGTSNAQMPGVIADSRKKEIDADYAAWELPNKKKEALRAAAEKTSTAELQEAERKIKQMRLSNDPAVRAQGDAMWPRLQEVSLERDKIEQEGKQRMREIGAQGANQMSVARFNAENRPAPAAQPQMSDDLETRTNARLFRARSAGDQKAIYDTAAVEAAQSGNQRLANMYTERSNALIEQINTANKNAAGAPGQVDFSGMTKGQVPVNPNRELAPKPLPFQPQGGASQPPLASSSGLTLSQERAKAQTGQKFNSVQEVMAAKAANRVRSGDYVMIAGRPAQVP